MRMQYNENKLSLFVFHFAREYTIHTNKPIHKLVSTANVADFDEFSNHVTIKFL